MTPMILVGASAATVAGAALMHLSSRHQQWLAHSLGRASGWLGAVVLGLSTCVLASLMHVAVGLCTALILTMATWIALPYGAIWLRRNKGGHGG